MLEVAVSPDPGKFLFFTSMQNELFWLFNGNFAIFRTNFEISLPYFSGEVGKIAKSPLIGDHSRNFLKISIEKSTETYNFWYLTGTFAVFQKFSKVNEFFLESLVKNLWIIYNSPFLWEEFLPKEVFY